MVLPPESPLPLRQHQGNINPKTPPVGKAALYFDDIEDDYGGDTVPCSPSALLGRTTQPTQILSRPPLSLVGSSSPVSVVEVPASSPFQRSSPAPMKPLSRLAPAGTVFRPPAKRPNTTPTIPSPPPKRQAPIIELSSDEESDIRSPRADIRPTEFRKHIASFAFTQKTTKPPADQMRKLLKQIYDVFGTRFSAELVREGLEICLYDLDNTIQWLESSSAKKPKAARPSSTSTKTQSTLPFAKLKKDSPVKPKRRRLVQGRRQRSPTPEASSSDDKSDESDDEPVIIEVKELDNSKQDEFQAENSSDEESEDEADALLNCINTNTVQELAAMTGLTEAIIEPVISQRPFKTIGQARKIAGKKLGYRSSYKTSGEAVISQISNFLAAARSVDEVISSCETKATLVKGVIETWDIDSFGHEKSSNRASPEKDLPMTPSSLGMSRFKKPLAPKQPSMMDGNCVMKPFQLYGLNWMRLLYNYDIGCILADEMGLGKTCQVISLLCNLVETYQPGSTERRPWPNLVVVPPSTYNNWLIEFEKFAPQLSVIGYRGSQTERGDIAYEVANNSSEYHVVLGTYSQIHSEMDLEAMQSFDLNAAIFDEGHKMKNPATKLYRDLSRIRSSWKMLLTGK